MIIHKQTEWIRMIIITWSVSLCVTSCDSGELPGEQQQPGSIELRFVAGLSTPQTTKVPEIISGAAFPNGGTYTFGLFLTDETGGGVPEGTQANMKSTLDKTGTTEVWTHATSGNASITPGSDPGKQIKITGYYPWVQGATNTKIPFDLSTGMDGQKDMLYLSSPSNTTLSVVPSDGKVALIFSHVYTWVKIKLSSLTQSPAVYVTSVSLGNKHSGLTWIKNKGTFNPGTGNINGGATAGDLVVTFNQAQLLPYDGNSPIELDFLVPPILSANIKDGDIVIRVTTQDDKVLMFPLNKIHLNNANGKYGFQKGMKNTYDVVYNNAAMSLGLSGWQSQTITENELGGAEEYISWTVTCSKYQAYGYGITVLSSPDNHIYRTYLGEVVENNNGAYIPYDNIYNQTEGPEWQKVTKAEPAYPTIMISKKDAAGGALVPWKDAGTNGLVARQYCIDLREGGYKDWRLPRISELKVMVLASKEFDLPQGASSLGYKYYWSGTESSKDACLVSFYEQVNVSTKLNYPRSVNKSDVSSVRCIREATPLP